MAKLTVSRLMASPSFINYCFNTNEADVAYWNHYLVQNPQQQPIVDEAKEIVKMGGWILTAEKEKAGTWKRIHEAVFDAHAVRCSFYNAIACRRLRKLESLLY